MDTSSGPGEPTVQPLQSCSPRGTSTCIVRVSCDVSRSYILLGTANKHFANQKHLVLELDSVAFTLKLLGAPIEPIFDASTDHMFLAVAFSFIVCKRIYWLTLTIYTFSVIQKELFPFNRKCL